MIDAKDFLASRPPALDGGGTPEPDVAPAFDEPHGSGVMARDRHGMCRGGRARVGGGADRHAVGRRSRSGFGPVTLAEDPQDVDSCREAALRLLDAAPRSSGALRDRLCDKGYDADVVDAVVARLTEVRLLDDESYAQSVVRYCAGRMMGARGTMMELSRKGVPREIARRAVAQADEAGVFEDAAWELGRRYARKTEGMDPDKRRQRFWSAGGRKGHDPETLRRVAGELL